VAGQIEALLAEAAAALRRRSSAFAIIGGIAISARVEPRFTRDLDLAVAVADDREAEGLARDFQAAGFAAVAVIEQEKTGRLATVRCQRQSELGHGPMLDLLFASSGIEPEIAAAAERLEVFPNLWIPVATVAHLIALKVLSRDDKTRPQDYLDLRALLGVATGEDLERAEEALETITIRGFNRERPLGALLQALIQE
jgi:hypothetical protein